MPNHGKIIYQENNRTFNRIKSIIIGIPMIITIFGLIFFEVIFPLWYDYSKNNIGKLLLFESFIFVAITVSISFYYWKLMEFPFNIFEFGFTYRLRLAGANKKENFLSYTEITNIYFISYGLSCILTTNKGHEVQVDAKYNPISYTTLMTLLINKLNITKYPDFDVIVNYINSDKEEIVKYIGNTIVNTQNSAYEHLADINRDFA